jgi:UDP-N-acetylglucosamine 1-carboxyvinyltransferase
MGVCIREENGMLYAAASFLKGTDLVLRMRSVGATEQGILAGVCARGRTTLFPCAREPEIVCLCRFLRKMGAQIEGEGSDQIRITGVERLHGAYMTLPADRIVAGTYLCAGAATRGYVELDGAPKEELTALLEVYQKMGGQYEYRSGKLIADSTGVRNPVPCLSTDVYPGFPTDLQSPVLAVFATIPGVSRIRESVFEDRFKAAESLRQFGARIRTSGCEAEITGGYPLTGCRTQAQELRGGAALVVAALSAKGHSIVSGYSFIRRGYEDICRDLTALGGCVRESTG